MPETTDSITLALQKVRDMAYAQGAPNTVLLIDATIGVRKTEIALLARIERDKRLIDPTKPLLMDGATHEESSFYVCHDYSLHTRRDGWTEKVYLDSPLWRAITGVLPSINFVHGGMEYFVGLSRPPHRCRVMLQRPVGAKMPYNQADGEFIVAVGGDSTWVAMIDAIVAAKNAA